MKHTIRNYNSAREFNSLKNEEFMLANQQTDSCIPSLEMKMNS